MSTKIDKEAISKIIAMVESPIYVPINNSIIAAMEGPIVSPYINDLIVKTNSTNNENKSKL